MKAERQEKEKDLVKQNKDVPFQGWDKVEEERFQADPKLWLVVQDSAGNLIRRIEAPAGKGFHRVAWDLRRSGTNSISLDRAGGSDGYYGLMVPPGNYKVNLAKQIDGKITNLSGLFVFNVEMLRSNVLKGSNPNQVYEFWKGTEMVYNSAQATYITLESANKKLKAMENALLRANIAPGVIDSQIYIVKRALQKLDIEFTGNKSKDLVGEKNNPTVFRRLSVARMGVNSNSYGPTLTQQKSIELASKQLHEIKAKLEKIVNTDIPSIEKLLIDAGAPWIEGQKLP
jgi:hypothetical protein